jgi:hypothetical protein
MVAILISQGTLVHSDRALSSVIISKRKLAPLVLTSSSHLKCIDCWCEGYYQTHRILPAFNPSFFFYCSAFGGFGASASTPFGGGAFGGSSSSPSVFGAPSSGPRCGAASRGTNRGRLSRTAPGLRRGLFLLFAAPSEGSGSAPRPRSVAACLATTAAARLCLGRRVRAARGVFLVPLISLYLFLSLFLFFFFSFLM